jgi:biotin carboxylase
MSARILAGFAESLAAPECVWSLRDAGFDVVLFARRGARPALRYSKRLAIVEVEPPELDAARAARQVADHARALGVAATMPFDDAAVWALDRAEPELPAVLGPTGEQARFALDKEVQVAAARNAGFGVPPTRVAGADELLAAPDKVDFPSYVKPAAAVEAVDGRLARHFGGMCADAAELAAVAAPFGDARVLVQPVVRGTNHGLFGFFADGELLATHAHERVRMVAPAGSGSSACRPAPVPSELLQPLRRLLSTAGWNGMFMVEFLRDRDGNWWFVELNGRAWGSMALARDIGAEYPAWVATKALEDPQFRPPRVEYAGHGFVCRHLGRDIVHLLSVLRGHHSRAALDWPRRGKTLRDVLVIRRSDRWYNARRGESKVFLYDAYRTVFDFLRSFVRRRFV